MSQASYNGKWEIFTAHLLDCLEIIVKTQQKESMEVLQSKDLTNSLLFIDICETLRYPLINIVKSVDPTKHSWSLCKSILNKKEIL